MRMTLDGLPSGCELENAYQQAWKNITNQHPLYAQVAQAVLLWLVNAQRPMTLVEVQWSIAVCSDTFRFIPERVVSGDLLIAVCHGLVVVEEETKSLCLVRTWFSSSPISVN